ncbi:MAG: hypothetical protein PHE56_00615 [Bacteroidales bacterium]|nr:hypothetical protein [Bacteroidales bacterium]
MKKIIILLIVLCISILNAFSQSKSREIIVNNGDTIVKCRVRTEPLKYKPNAEVIYFWYKSNRIYTNKGGYDGLLLTDFYSVYYKGNLIEKGEFVNGIKTGTWIKWDTEGRIVEKSDFKKGLLCGEQIKYLADGTIEKQKYKKGELCQQDTKQKKQQKNIEVKKSEKKTPIESSDKQKERKSFKSKSNSINSNTD